MPTISGFSKALGSAIVPGGPVGVIKVPGSIKPGDTLLAVSQISEGAPPTRIDRTAECVITAGQAGSITTSTTNMSGSFLHILWVMA